MSPGMATRHARCVRHDSQERANARGFHEEARHCQARKRERLQLGVAVEHHERQPLVAFQRMLAIKVDNRLLLPLFGARNLGGTHPLCSLTQP